jgi:uncharacterized membrane protein
MREKRLLLVITPYLVVMYALLTTLAIFNVAGIFPTRFPFTTATTLYAFVIGFLHAGQSLGWRKSILLVLLVFVVGLIFESIGVATGAIYGPYHYSNLLGPKFLGLVPYLIPVAWFMMVYPSFVIADRLVSSHASAPVRILLVSLVGGIAMTAWDLGMDPLMVKAGHWVWEVQGAYFGVPVQNFWGWWLTTFTALSIFQILAVKFRPQLSHVIPDVWAIWLYAITGLGTIIVDVLIDLPGPALVGLFAMAPWVIIGFMSHPSGRIRPENVPLA